jgi:hypothetical protein
MLSPQLPPARRPLKRRQNLWFERMMAIVALANLGLVLFDLTYIPLRNFWLLGKIKLPLLPTLTLPLPPAPDICKPLGEQPDRATLITACYDRTKGIEAYRDTQAYLDTVNQLEHQLQQNGLQSAAVAQTLRSLQEQSTLMVSENWFTVAEKSGTLEKVKDRLRDRIYVENASVAARAVGNNPAQELRFKRACSARRSDRHKLLSTSFGVQSIYLKQARSKNLTGLILTSVI